MLTFKTIIVIGNILLGLALPVGYAIGLRAGRDTDPAGRGYALLASLILTLLVIYVPVAVTFVVTGLRCWAQMSGPYRFFLLSPAWLVIGLVVVGVCYGIYVAFH
jgi:hypothetical protein